MSTTVTTKGQVTIPKRMRDYLGLRPGSSVDFEFAADGEVVIRPVKAAGRKRKATRRFAALKGAGKHVGMSTDAYMRLVRAYGEDHDDPGFADAGKPA